MASDFVDISDENFEQALIDQGIDDFIDGKVRLDRVEALKTLQIKTDYGITSLSGIEFFTSLETLWVWHNDLSSIDVSKNTKLVYLGLYDNPITSLDVRQNTSLQILSVSETKVREIDLSKNVNLVEFVGARSSLEKLDFTNNLSLQRIYIWETNVSELDLSHNLRLTDLWASDTDLKSIDLSSNKNLQVVSLDSCNLSEVTLGNSPRRFNTYGNPSLIEVKVVDENFAIRTDYDDVFNWWVRDYFTQYVGELHSLNKVLPDICVNDRGTILQTWSFFNEAKNIWEVKASSLLAIENSTPREIENISGEVGEMYYSSSAVLVNGNFLVVWSSQSQGSDRSDINGRIFDENRTPQSLEFLINTELRGSQSQPTVCATSDGGFIAAWTSDSFSSNVKTDIRFQKFDSSGQKVGAELTANTYLPDSQCWPTVAELPDGGWLVAWASYEQDGSSFGVFAQRYSKDGEKIADEIQINALVANEQTNPKIAVLADGGWIIAFASSGHEGSWNDGYGIFTRRYDANGAPVSQEIFVNEYTNFHQQSPDVVSLPDGGWLLTWMSGGQNGDGWSIYARRYNANGNALGHEILISDSTSSYNVTPTVALAGLKAVFSWQKLNSLEDGSSIVTKLIDLEDFASDSIFGGAGNDTLDALAGANKLFGGTGDDTYLVNNVDDFVFENQAEGKDTVVSSVNYSLPANVEGLRLTGLATSGMGNGLPNRIEGSGEDNVLNGGRGNDTLVGRGGDDSLKGGLGADRLLGGDGNDLLIGGAGNDTLTGGLGSDAFVLDSLPSANARFDTVVDFAAAADKLRLDDDVFAAFTVGVALTASQFVSGAGITTAQTTDQRIAYNTTTGALYYDADGAGGVGAVQFAVLGSTTHPALSVGDFVIVG